MASITRRALLTSSLALFGLQALPGLGQPKAGPAPAPSAVPPASLKGRPIVIGLDLEAGHLTSTSDDAIRMGALTAIDEINAAGGVLGGRPLRVLERDNRSVPARGRDHAHEFAGDPDVVAFLCGKFSPVALEQAKVADERRIILLDPWAAADGIVAERPAGTWTFRLSLRDSWAIPAMMEHLRARGIGKVGVYLVASSWGRSNEVVIARHAAAGLKPAVAGIEWYNWGTRSMLPGYERLRAAGAQAILLVANEGEGSLLVREIAGLPAAERLPVVSHWGISGGSFVALAGPALEAVDLAVVQTFTFEGLSTPKAAAVVQRAARLFNLPSGARSIPSQGGFAHAYDLVHILARALAQAGSAEREAVRLALEQVRDYHGLVDRFAQPFSAASHEALEPRHVFIGRFTRAGTVERVRR